jgi:hypothetical protein
MRAKDGHVVANHLLAERAARPTDSHSWRGGPTLRRLNMDTDALSSMDDPTTTTTLVAGFVHWFRLYLVPKSFCFLP